MNLQRLHLHLSMAQLERLIKQIFHTFVNVIKVAIDAYKRNLADRIIFSGGFRKN